MVDNIKALNLSFEEVGISPNEEVVRKQSFVTLKKLLKSKDSIIIQRPRATWLKEGDVNSRNKISSSRICDICGR